MLEIDLPHSELLGHHPIHMLLLQKCLCFSLRGVQTIDYPVFILVLHAELRSLISESFCVIQYLLQRTNYIPQSHCRSLYRHVKWAILRQISHILKPLEDEILYASNLLLDILLRYVRHSISSFLVHTRHCGQ